MAKIKKFKQGDTVVFNPISFDKRYWDSLSEQKRILYYGCFGYGLGRPTLFTYLCDHNPQDGHCVLINMKNQKIETMCHNSEFRLANEEEV